MARPDFPRTIMEFQDRFATEAACLDYLAGLALAAGLRLPALWRASRLGARAPASMGVLGLLPADPGHSGHGDAPDTYPATNLVLAAYLVATHHPGSSAKQLQRQLGLSRYETA